MSHVFTANVKEKHKEGSEKMGRGIKNKQDMLKIFTKKLFKKK